jgi:acetyltransferase
MAGAHLLQPLLAPASIALVGASDRPGSVGNAVRANLRDGGFEGRLYWVNPRHERIGAERCYASLRALPEPVDLAVVTAPAKALPGIVGDATHAGTRALAVLSAGFGETGEQGRALEREVAAAARAARIPMLGPNCVGVLRPSIGMNASFARTSTGAGGVALVSQSGAICTALVDWASEVKLGLSSVVSLGAAADLDFGTVLDYLARDPDTRSVLLYVEGVRQGRRFVSALRALARSKPVVVLKVGRHASASRAARSHTGALAGDDAVFDAVLRRCGAVRVYAYHELFAAAKALAIVSEPIGNRIAVVTNGGGPGVLAADAAPGARLEMAALSGATLAALDRVLPAHASRANPVDLIGDATGARYAAAVEAVLLDPGVDAVVTAYAPTGVSDALEVAGQLIPIARAAPKPVFTSWLGEPGVHDARRAAEDAGVAAFPVAEIAVQALGVAARWSANQRLLREVPPANAAFHAPGRAPVATIFKRAAGDGRRLLTEVESKELLAQWGIGVPALAVATTRDAAVAEARRIGFPVALKILSRDITHKSDVDGVRLSLHDEAAVRDAFDAILANAKRLRPEARIDGVAVQEMVSRRNAREVLVGVSTDPVFGPVITFGAGGVAVELLRDSAVALPPLNERLALELVARTRVAKLIGAYRNVPAASTAALVDVLLRVSDMVCELPWIAEMDINPLLVDAQGAIALDARIAIDLERPARDATWSHLAIHPYPAHLEHAGSLRDATPVRLRPIRPEDAAMEADFLAALSAETRYRRFLSMSRQTSPEIIARLTQVDYDREMALVAVHGEAPDAQIVGVARYVPGPGPHDAEFAIAIADRWQRRGLGSLLMQQLEHCAHEAGVRRLEGMVLASNAPMLALMRARLYECHSIPSDATVIHVSTTLPRKDTP